MKLIAIAAVAENNVIGINNSLPWHLPEDLAFFKKTTMGAPIVMGRKTYESINRPLPGRLNIVITGNKHWQPQPDKHGNAREVICHPSELPQPKIFSKSPKPTVLARAHGLDVLSTWLAAYDKVFLIGGSQLYNQAIESKLLDELILTEIHQSFEGDAYFPNWEKSEFNEVSRIKNTESPERSWSYDFVRYTKNID